MGQMGANLQHELPVSRVPAAPPPDREPLHAVGDVMLALENAELRAALRESRRELVDARARIIRAGDRARRQLEQDLHDGAQQRLTAIMVKLGMAREAAQDGDRARQLESISVDVELAVDELRTLARGLYPAALRVGGLAAAVRSLAIGAPIPVEVIDKGIGRCSASVEAAVYFCMSEAVQNAIKHAGRDARVAMVLRRGPRGGVRFEVTDDGVGMNMPIRSDGIGLTSMRDRIGAASGDLEIISAPGRGTMVRGEVPDDRRSSTPRRQADSDHSSQPRRPRLVRALGLTQ